MLKQAFSFGLWTFLSRILGFLRDLLMAVVIGAGMLSDAFIVALRFPNLFRRFFAEGAFLSAFVPIYIAIKQENCEENDIDKSQDFINATISALALILIILSIFIIIFMDNIIALIAPGFVDDAMQYELAVMMARITFIYLFCMSICAVLSGFLNSIGHSWVMAMAPNLFNISFICVLMMLYYFPPEHITISALALSICVVMAGFLQLCVMWFACHHYGLRIKLRNPFHEAQLGRLMWLMLPGMISAGAIQINALVGDIIASMMAQGSISWLYYAERLQQLPIGLIGVALNIALLPAMTASYKANDLDNTMKMQAQAIDIGLWLVLPATIGFLLFADDVIAAIFGYGAFDKNDQINSAYALRLFALAIPAAILIKCLQPSFFMREDTKTPLIITIIGIICNIILAVSLSNSLNHGAIALASSASLWLQMLIYIILLQREKLLYCDKIYLFNMFKSLISAITMGVICYGILVLLLPYSSLTRISIIIPLAILLYFACCAMIKGHDLRNIKQYIK